MIDPTIPLRGVSVDTATPIRQANQDAYDQQFKTEQILKAHYENMTERDKARLTSVVAGASQLKSFLDNNDLDGAHNFLVNRRNALITRQAHGENVDTAETDAALQMLRTGNVKELSDNVNGLLAAGQVYGLLSSKDMPANVQEWQYYNSLKPEEQTQYLNMKRAGQIVNLGGTQMIPNPANPAGKPQATFEVTPKPEDDPEFRGQQKRAEAIGAASGQAEADLPGVEMDADQMLQAIEAVRSSPGLSAIVGAPNPLKGGLGVANIPGTPAADAQAKLDRVQGQTFFQAYQRLKGGGQITEIEGKKGEAAIAALQKSQSEPEFRKALDGLALVVQAAVQRQKTKAGMTSSLPSAEGVVPRTPGKKVTVTNGQETYSIDAADLPHAQAEGFKVVK